MLVLVCLSPTNKCNKSKLLQNKINVNSYFEGMTKTKENILQVDTVYKSSQIESNVD